MKFIWAASRRRPAPRWRRNAATSEPACDGRGTRILQQTEQVAREIVATRPNIVLTDVELVQLSTGRVLVFSTQNPREPSAEHVGRFETALRERLGEPGVPVIVRTVDSTDITSKGRILLGEGTSPSSAAPPAPSAQPPH